MAKEKLDLLQGTLDVMVLRTLETLGPLHGYGISRRIEQVSGTQTADSSTPDREHGAFRRRRGALCASIPRLLFVTIEEALEGVPLPCYPLPLSEELEGGRFCVTAHISESGGTHVALPSQYPVQQSVRRR